MEGPVEISFTYFVLLTLITALITYSAWVNGFYKIARETNRNASLLQTVIAFLLFLAPALFLAPVFKEVLEHLFFERDWTFPYLYLRLLSGILSILATALILWGFTKLNIFKNTRLFSFSAFVNGAMTWFIAYPQMIVLSVIMNFVTVNLLGLTPSEQSSVTELRQAKAYPELFGLWILTIAFIVPICEEILFRGYLQSSLKRLFSRRAALILASIIFSLFHYSQTQGAGNLVILPSLFFFSLYLGFVYEKWSSISSSFGLHMIFNLLSSLMIVF